MAASAFRTDWPDPDRSRSEPKNNNAWCCFTSTEIVGLSGTAALDGHLDFHTALEIWGIGVVEVDYIQRYSFTIKMISPVRVAAMRAILCFINREGRSHKDRVHKAQLLRRMENRSEPETDVCLLTSLTPYR